MKNKIAKIIRIITVPPVMVCVLLLILYFGQTAVFADALQLIWALLFLMIMPVLAYPLSYIIPKVKEKGRPGQRDLAFMLSFIGYGLGLVFVHLSQGSAYLMLVYLTYFASVVILIILNKVIKIKASGHACSITGPLILLVYFLGIKSLPYCVVVYAAVLWSSLARKEHNLKELLWGSLTPVLSLCVALLIFLPVLAS